MKTDSEKLAYVLAELERVVIPGSEYECPRSYYWDQIQTMCDNAVDEFVDIDNFHKQLIKYIKD